mmetsp:Transcript_57612/g.166793  ORF Transcript_57612/g.166793 Transcript_57612/m.166793 type:complete len:256 (-) Transcript_57612:31-798(-)
MAPVLLRMPALLLTAALAVEFMPPDGHALMRMEARNDRPDVSGKELLEGSNNGEVLMQFSEKSRRGGDLGGGAGELLKFGRDWNKKGRGKKGKKRGRDSKLARGARQKRNGKNKRNDRRRNKGGKRNAPKSQRQPKSTTRRQIMKNPVRTPEGIRKWEKWACANGVPDACHGGPPSPTPKPATTTTTEPPTPPSMEPATTVEPTPLPETPDTQPPTEEPRQPPGQPAPLPSTQDSSDSSSESGFDSETESEPESD